MKMKRIFAYTYAQALFHLREIMGKDVIIAHSHEHEDGLIEIIGVIERNEGKRI